MSTFGTIRVGPGGPETALIALLGQSPGQTEEEEGEPFVGRVSVDALYPAVASARLQWPALYRTNVFKHRLLAGNVDVIRSEVDKVRQEIAKELKRLQNLRAVVTLGNEALYCVTRNWGITHFLGKHWTWDSHQNAPLVLPTLHPSYVARTRWENIKYQGRSPMWWLIDRLERAREESEK